MTHEVTIVQAVSQGFRAQAATTVLDVDFGNGFLFLQLWDAWRCHPHRPARLHVIGLLPRLPERAEWVGMLVAQMAVCSAKHLQPLLETLQVQWPLSLPGLQRLEFESGSVTLTLAVGERDVMLDRLRVRVNTFVIKDCHLLPKLTGLAAPDAHVWLSNESGGIAVTAGAPLQFDSLTTPATDPWLQSPVALSGRHALVVGAGFAGMGVAQSLVLRGWRVTVIDTNWGNKNSTHQLHGAAALTPMVSRDDSIAARLSRAGSLRAQVRWADMSDEVIFRCGAVQLERHQGRIVDLQGVLQALRFPEQWVQYVNADRASELAGMSLNRGGLYFPTAARVNPQGLINALAALPGIDMLGACVKRLGQAGGEWQVLDADSHVLARAPHVILAGGFETQSILAASGLLSENARLRNMHALGGEISFISASDIAGGPQCIVAGDGYVLPESEGKCVVGSTYVHGAAEALVTPSGWISNLSRAAGLLNIPELAARFEGRTPSGWAGWRAVLPGRLPAIGPVLQAPGLWVACGFASRGLTWASAAGDLIASALNGEPLILENDIIEAISDN